MDLDYLESVISAFEGAVDTVTDVHNRADYDNKEITAIAKKYWRLKELHDRAKKAVTAVYHIVNAFDKGVFPAQLEKRDLDMIRIPELARSFSIRTNTSASMIDKERAFEWLREHGHGDLVQETVNSGTLASFARSLQIDEGIDLPDDIFKVSTYNSIGSAKYNPNKGA